MPPKVSVLVPVYNVEKYLKRCIDSILTQTFADIEIIILDDGSDDNSLQIAESYSDRRISIDLQPHGGIASARNRLLSLAAGEYIYFVDADDWVEPNAIECLLEYAESYSLDITFCGRVGQTTTDKDIEIMNREHAVARFLSTMELSSAMWTKMVRSSVIKQLEFDSRVLYGEDGLMTWRLINKARRIGLTNCRPYHYSDNPASITNSSFSDATYSLRLVWDTIVAETAAARPTLLAAARQKQLYCYCWLLYTALRSGTPRDRRIQTIQDHLRTNRSLWGASIASPRLRFLTRLSTYFYTPLRYLLAPIRSQMPPLR
ncbi:MAG: glycosyltransferase family 2 protein [Muribaculaceae bacterium]|nr:glycosyltransferase family 2 protein [Muribaculaceae bacterium]